MKPSEGVMKNLGFLKHCMLAKGKSRHKRLIEHASDEQLLCLVEVCLNILKGRVPLRKPQLRRLQANAYLLRRLARTRCARSARNVLQQGKGLPAIAGILANIVVPILAGAFLHK